MKHVKFSKHCRIETQTPLSVQADGDTIGETPIEIKVLHESLRVIIGENYEEQKTSERSKK
jgi:diacylglycerol kinase family enzyme